jgi:hypothetical protein
MLFYRIGSVHSAFQKLLKHSQCLIHILHANTIIIELEGANNIICCNCVPEFPQVLTVQDKETLRVVIRIGKVMRKKFLDFL